jgi:beta-lactamase regulating signal transducer with metallopeptidase domain
VSIYLIVSLLGKLTCLLAAGLLLDGLLRDKLVLIAAAMWNALLVALVALPIAILVVPEWRLPVLAADAKYRDTVLKADPVGADEQQASREPSQASPRDATVQTPREPGAAARAFPAAAPADSMPANAVLDQTGPHRDWSTAATGLIVIYFFGLGFAVIRLLAACRAIHFLRRDAAPLADPRWLQRFEHWLARLRLTSSRTRGSASIQLLKTHQMEVPAALGLRHRAVLIPARITADLEISNIDAILLHELGHFARRDCTWQLLQRIIEAVLWFHPLMWLAGRRITFIRERSCDEFAVHGLGNSQPYVETLLDIAANLAQHPAPELGLTMLRSGTLERRLRALQDSNGNSRLNAPVIVRMALAIGALCCATLLASLAAGRARAERAPNTDANAQAKEAEKAEVADDATQEVEPLKQLKASLARINKIAFAAVNRTTITTTATPNGECGNQKWIKVVRDGDKWAVVVKKSGTMLYEGKPRGFSTFHDVLFNGDQAIQINQAHDGGPPLDKRDSRPPFGDPRQVPLPTESKEMLVMGSVDGSPPMQGVQPIEFLDSGRLLFGRLTAVDVLVERLAGGKVDPEKALPDLPECVAVTKTGEYGTCTAWLDPRHGFLPKRIEMRKRGDDKTGDTPINKIAPRDDGPRALWPSTQMTGFDQVVDNISFADLGDVPVIQKLTDTWMYSYEKEQHLTLRNEFAAEDFHFPKAEEVSLTIKVPDHTVVTMHGQRDSGYQWYHGKIVRDADVKDKSTQRADRRIHVQVLSSSGVPLTGAKIYAAIWADDPAKTNQDYPCDAEGRATISIPAKPRIVRLWAHLPKHVSQFMQWWPDMDSNTRIDNVPEEFTFRLEGGTIISGFVKDDEGKSISGVTVEVRLVNGGIQTTKTPVPDTWLSEGVGAITTDERGVWLLDKVPAGEDVKVEVKLSHPDYESDYAWGHSQKQQGVTTKSLREGTGTIVMHRGTSVQGSVTGPDGKPIVGAVVIWGDGPYLQEGSQEERSDRHGHFTFPPLPEGPMRLTAVAEGFAPVEKMIAIKRQIEPVNFQLGPGKTMRLRFVDKKGAPVPDVYVGIEGWRGAKALYNHRHSNVIDTRIPYKSDDQGIYEWTWAPDDPVSFTFHKEGYDYERARSFTAGDGEQTVTLQ